MTGGEILVRCLIEQGVSTIFGMPGGHLEAIYDALYHHQSEIKHVLIRNEQAASLMADGYARASGRPGVCLVIPGPGASNAATGIAEAASASSPVLLITSRNEAALANKHPSKVFHGLDHIAFFSPIARLCRMAQSVEDIPPAVAEAFSILRSGRPGPVVLEIPKDILDQEGSPPIPGRIEPAPKRPGESEIVEAARRIAEAARPVLIAGGGVLFSGACEALRRLAERLHAPVVTTQTARGALSDDHPLSLGDILGKPARAAIAEADLAVALGCRFVHFDTAGWTLKLPRLIHIEADASYLGSDYPTDVAIAADVRPAIEMLCDQLADESLLRAAGTRTLARSATGLTDESIRCAWGERVQALRGQLEINSPPPIIAAIQNALSKEVIVVGDVHMTAYRMRRAFKVTSPRSYFASNSYCTVGYALPAALGAKAAFPGRPVVSVSGDGGFVMTCQELATAAQCGLHVVAVVVNDNCFTSIKGGQHHRRGGRYIAVDLQNPDFVAMAKAFGVKGCRAANEAELEKLLAEAVRQEATTVIEIPIPKRY